MGLSMQEKKALTAEISKRYQKAAKKEKTGILNELIKNTGYHRKYILHVLANWGKTATICMDGKTVKLTALPRKRLKGGGRKRKYTEDFGGILRKIWAFFSYRCGKILAPFIQEQISFLENPFRITEKHKGLFLSVSPATIDRILKADKKKLALKGKKGTKPGKLLKKQIPVRTYYADADKKPGFFVFYTVYHCGTADSGEFCPTLTATDVYSGWVELRPTLNKAHKWVFEALLDVKSSLPFPLTGIDSDNGSEFINSALLKWCQDERIQFTRSRSYHKNDSCFAEQKNFTCVRNFVGYCRFSAAAERDALAKVYRSLCPLLSFFMPNIKLISKKRAGAKIKKLYDKNVISPYQRLMASEDLSDEAKKELARRFEQYNPVMLQQEVHNAVDALMSLNRSKNLEDGKTLALSALQAV
jgi:hypothetical protein